MRRRRFLALAGLGPVAALLRPKPHPPRPPHPTTTTTTPAATTTTVEPMPTFTTAPTTVVVPAAFVYDVLILTGDSNATAQSKINAATSTAIIGFEAGAHYERKVTPKLGQTLRGDPRGTTVLDGSRLVTGWTGSNPWVANHTVTDRGVTIDDTRSADRGDQYPEELFFETPGQNTGWTRKHRTGDPSTSTPGAGDWTMSYAAGTLRVAENPTATTVRLSVTDQAIVSPGVGAGGLTVEDITFQKYASITFGSAWANQETGTADHRDWTFRRVACFDIHGGGANFGPGDSATNLKLGYNGCMGFWGNTSVSGYSNGFTLVDSEILYNMRAKYDWSWSGGCGKFETPPNAGQQLIIRNCWVHHNNGIGIWADVNTTAAGASLIESNLAEDNEINGVFWEITAGTALIRWNLSRRNGAGSVANNGGPAVNDEDGCGYDISNSRGVLLTQNVVDGCPTGIMVRDDGRSPFLDGCSVQDNSVKASGGTGDGNIVKFRPDVDGTRIATCGADNNRYWSGGAFGFSYNNVFGMSFASWQAARGGPGLTGALDPNGTSGLTGAVTNPATFKAFTLSRYGPGV